MRIDVTVKDLDKALSADVAYPPQWSYCKSCILSQAGKRHFKNVVVTTGVRMVVHKQDREARSYYLDDVGQTIVQLFDNRKYAELRSLLPVSVELKRLK